MKYVKKDIEQLIKANIGIKIRKLKLCGRIDSESTNKILLFFKDNVLNYLNSYYLIMNLIIIMLFLVFLSKQKIKFLLNIDKEDK